jgi:uncharacterized glyoxalase superfamily protein PhnB
VSCTCCAAGEIEKGKFVAITPYLYYEDVDRALKFLAKAFGFRPHGRAVRAPDGQITHAAMKGAGALIMMGRPPSGYRSPKHLGQTTQCLYIDVARVDRHFDRARKAGAHVLERPTETEYGHRRYGVTDPEGHEWYFAQPLRRGSAKSRSRAPHDRRRKRPQ